MALRQIMINRKIGELEAERAALKAKIASTAERRTAWKNREAAAVTALGEMNEQTSAEERSAFEAEAAEIEAEDEAITAEETANTTRSCEIENEISTLKNELADIEKRSRQTPKSNTNTTTRKGESYNMGRYTREYRERCADLATRSEVKEFLGNVRGLAERGITNTALTIPTVVLPTLRERIDTYSKLSPVVNIKPIRGEGKQNIIGSVPEAVWTETTGKFNELSFDFAQISVDGSKVAGYIPVPNPYLQDSDEDLSALVLDMLGQAIGLAKDKAILYGTASNMP
ncbi:MAG: phage major capsid protein, partial [Eubacteriales bacterium]